MKTKEKSILERYQEMLKNPDAYKKSPVVESIEAEFDSRIISFAMSVLAHAKSITHAIGIINIIWGQVNEIVNSAMSNDDPAEDVMEWTTTYGYAIEYLEKLKTKTGDRNAIEISNAVVKGDIPIKDIEILL